MLPVLRPHVARAATVEDAALVADLPTQPPPGLDLGEPEIGVGGVAQDQEVEAPVLGRRPRRRSCHIAFRPAKTRAVSSL